MDSFILTFLSAFFAEMGDRSQILVAVLAMRFARDKIILLAVLLATICNATLAAYLGSFIDDVVSEDPVMLFRGLAYAMAGFGMLGWQRSVDLLENWRLGAFWTCFLGIFILQFGNKAQFIIAANATQAAHWAFVAIGGVAGTMAALIPAIWFKAELSSMLPIIRIRQVAGAAMLFYGLILALSAWGII